MGADRNNKEEDIMYVCNRVDVNVEKLSEEDNMRSMTDEEARWLAAFDYTYNRARTSSHKYLCDTLRGSRIDGGKDLDTVDVEPVKENSSTLTTKTRKVASTTKRVPYSPLDYWVLPSIWYSSNWVDRVIEHIDAGKPDFEDTGIPGILNIDGLFHVNAFFEMKKHSLGRYTDIEDAKAVLKEFNKRVTTRGYGVDYE